jgi:hypothetical protein
MFELDWFRFKLERLEFELCADSKSFPFFKKFTLLSHDANDIFLDDQGKRERREVYVWT